MSDIIKIDNLSKSYGSVQAVKDLSLKVKEGELFAFLGVNGAGKSTTISMLCGFLKKDSGSILVNGLDIDLHPEVVKNNVGVVFQASALDKSLTVYQNLEHRASLYGIVGQEFKTRLNELVEMLDFKSFLHRAVCKLSGGQRRKADIARALLHKPKILILDEPTTGLDPQTRHTLWKVIGDLREKDGMTVFLTTHYMEEAADADYVVIIDAGSTVACGTPVELKNQYTGDFITVYGISEDDAKSLNIKHTEVVGGYRFAVENTAKATELIIARPEIFKDYEIVKGKMDDVFLAVTGKKLDGGNE